MPGAESGQVPRLGDLQSADAWLVDKEHFIVPIGLVLDLLCNVEELGLPCTLIEISYRASIEPSLFQELVDEGTLACSSAP